MEATVEYEFKYMRKANDPGHSLSQAPCFGTLEEAHRASREFGVAVVLLDIDTRKQVGVLIDNTIENRP